MSKIFIILFNASKQHWTLYVWHTACFSNQFMTSFPSFCSFLCLLSDKLVTRRLWSAVYWKQIARSQNLSLSSLSLRVHKSHVFYCLTVTAQHHKGKQEKKKMKCKVFCISATVQPVRFHPRSINLLSSLAWTSWDVTLVLSEDPDREACTSSTVRSRCRLKVQTRNR